MKKKIILVALLVCAVAVSMYGALAQVTTPTADSLELRQRNPANNGILVYYAVPAGTMPQLLTYNGATNAPEYSTLGTGLTRTGTVLNIAQDAHTQAWSTITSTPTTLTGYGITDGVRSVTAGTGLSGGTITSTGTISLPNVGTAGTYSGITTDAQGRVSAGTVRSFAYQTRALNTCFQPSASRDVMVAYAVDISATLSLAGGQVGTVYLRLYTNSSCTTGTQEVTRFVNGNTGSLTIGLNTTQNTTATLTGIIPAGSWAQLVTENTTGTPTFTARPGQEVAL